MPDPGSNGSEKPPVPDSAAREETRTEFVDRIIKRYGSANAALDALGDENLQYRARHRADTQEITTLRASVPKEGEGIVLKGDDYKAYKEFTELKLTPAQVKDAIAKRDELQGKLDAEAGKTLIARAAKATKYNAEVLEDLVKTKGLIIEVEQVDGKDIARIRTSKDAAPEVLNDDTVKKHLKPYLVALKTSSDAEERTTNTDDAGASDDGDEMEGTESVIPYPSQGRSGAKGNAKDPVGAHLSQYKTPSQMREAANSK